MSAPDLRHLSPIIASVPRRRLSQSPHMSLAPLPAVFPPNVRTAKDHDGQGTECSVLTWRPEENYLRQQNIQNEFLTWKLRQNCGICKSLTMLQHLSTNLCSWRIFLSERTRERQSRKWIEAGEMLISPAAIPSWLRRSLARTETHQLHRLLSMNATAWVGWDRKSVV